jgi:hypothetical protein
VAGRGRPKSTTFMKLGKVGVTRPDSMNWAVEEGEHAHFYSTLPSAIRHAVEAAAESRAKDAREWLAEYERITKKLNAILLKVGDEFREANCR